MTEKVKLLLIGNKRVKPTEAENTKRLFDNYAPGLYDITHLVGTEDCIKSVDVLCPRIIIINDKIKGAKELLEKIKQIRPEIVVFVFLSAVDDEQHAIDEYMQRGAYKCYMPPIIMDTLAHDMYVALHLE